MTSTTTPRQGTNGQGSNGPVSAGSRPSRRPGGDQPGLPQSRRSPRSVGRFGQWAATVLVVLAAVVGAGYLYLAKGETREVLVLDRPVPAGQRIEQADLGSEQVAGVDTAVPVEDLSQVLGKHTVVGLVPDQVLTRDVLTDTPVPASGQRVVAVELPPGRVPQTTGPGSSVAVVAVPANGDAGTTQQLDEPEVISPTATVHAVKANPDGTVVVSLLVTEAEATRLAAYSSTGRVTLVQSPAGE